MQQLQQEVCQSRAIRVSPENYGAYRRG
uniref:Uncharacterized protein n=1 Tax=Timema bartmani TaxID=61472 RepID=A0A7R9FDL7_9NEOP|nr:unnamed protein product [Timema bartmani]